ncbi:MAG: DEAD/DEAH box helicase [Myxococcaceae bacterium]|nr:DEAD/DEAH box helicase [Myxococcaceae bacterium]
MLLGAAEGHTGAVPPAWVVDHVLRITEGGDVALRQAAFEALLRRIKAMKEACDAWKIETAPHRRAALGFFSIAVSHGKSYRVWVRSLERLEGSCDCADFLRNSLGVCKHLWWLLERGTGFKTPAVNQPHPDPVLRWNPVRPLTGAGDWLERLYAQTEALPAYVRGAFVQREAQGTPKPTALREPLARQAFVQTLLTWVGEGRGAHVRAEPAVKALLERELETLDRQQEAPNARQIKTALSRLKRPLFQYQQQGVDQFLSQGSLLLADDMGLGKTAQAIAACHVLHTTGRVKRGLIIVPAALKAQWLREWQLFTPVPAEIVDGGPAERARQYQALRSGFLFLNYEQVLKDLPELLRLAPDMVVLDEAQRIKNWAAKTSVYVKKLQPRWRLVLSGTPLENRLPELASLMDWVDDFALEPKWRLTEWHTIRADGVHEAVGAKNLDTLRTRLAACSLRRVRKEVLSQLPPRTDTSVPVAMTDEQLEAHRELDRPIVQLMRVSKRRPLTQPEFLRLMSLMQRQRIICNGLAQRDFEQAWPAMEAMPRPTEAMLRGLFSPKLMEFRELVMNLVGTQGRKVVVFSQWKRMLRLAQWAVSDILADAGAQAVFFTGDEGQKRRTQNVIAFHDDPHVKLFFATDAGGVGLNLQRAASACVHLDLPWNPAVLEQRSGRIYRLGQHSPVEIYALVAANGIESRIATLLGGKKALFDGLFDGSSDEVRFEQGASFMSTMRQLVEPVTVPEAATASEEEELPETVDDVSDATPPNPAPGAAPEASPVFNAANGFAGIQVQRLADGRVILEAQPHAAEAFAAMLEGVAALMKQMAPRVPPEAGQ